MFGADSVTAPVSLVRPSRTQPPVLRPLIRIWLPAVTLSAPPAANTWRLLVWLPLDFVSDTTPALPGAASVSAPPLVRMVRLPLPPIRIPAPLPLTSIAPVPVAVRLLLICTTLPAASVIAPAPRVASALFTVMSPVARAVSAPTPPTVTVPPRVIDAPSSVTDPPPVALIAAADTMLAPASSNSEPVPVLAIDRFTKMDASASSVSEPAPFQLSGVATVMLPGSAPCATVVTVTFDPAFSAFCSVARLIWKAPEPARSGSITNGLGNGPGLVGAVALMTTSRGSSSQWPLPTSTRPASIPSSPFDEVSTKPPPELPSARISPSKRVHTSDQRIAVPPRPPVPVTSISAPGISSSWSAGASPGPPFKAPPILTVPPSPAVPAAKIRAPAATSRPFAVTSIEPPCVPDASSVPPTVTPASPTSKMRPPVRLTPVARITPPVSAASA